MPYIPFACKQHADNDSGETLRTLRQEFLDSSSIRRLDRRQPGEPFGAVYCTPGLHEGFLVANDNGVTASLVDANTARLKAAARQALPRNACRLVHHHVSPVTGLSLETMGSIKAQLEFRDECDEAAAAGFPHLLARRDWTALKAVSDQYRDSLVAGGRSPVWHPQVFRVLVPLGRAYPGLVLTLASELPTVLALSRRAT